METFKIKDVASDIQKELPIKVPKAVIIFVCKHVIAHIIKVMRTNKHRISLKHSDLNQIYISYDRERICREFSDLDETKIVHRKRR